MNELVMLLVVIGFIVVVPLGMLYFYYVRVIKNKNQVLEALSGIDVQLRKRYDLIPNILTIAQKFMEHEKEIFSKITELRTQAVNANLGSKEKFQAENALDTEMKALMVNVENYPTLKSDATMVQAMQTYNEVEEHISAARRFYNSALRELKNSVEIFPGSLFAGCAGEVKNLSFYEADATSRQPVKASDILK